MLPSFPEGFLFRGDERWRTRTAYRPAVARKCLLDAPRSLEGAYSFAPGTSRKYYSISSALDEISEQTFINRTGAQISMHANTRLVLAGQYTDGSYNSIAAPIYQTATFRFEDIGATKGFDYTRSGNPTRSALEELLAELEGGAGGGALNSGMAAISTVLATFNAGDQIICSHDCYGGTERLLCTLRDQGKLEVSFVDLTDPLALLDAKRPNTRAVWV